MTRKIGPGHDHPRDRYGRWTDSLAAAINLARAGVASSNPAMAEGIRKASGRRNNEYVRPVASRAVADNDPFGEDDPLGDPFGEDFGSDEDEDEDAAERQKYEDRLMREMEKAEKGALMNAIKEAGGLQTRDDLREEYRQIPNTYKRTDGIPGDEMAEYLSMYYPEFGIEDERDLIDYFAE